MKNTLRILFALSLALGLLGCGPQQDSNAPRPPAGIPGGNQPAPTQNCTAALISCPGGGFPEVSPAPECKQTCPAATAN